MTSSSDSRAAIVGAILDLTTAHGLVRDEQHVYRRGGGVIVPNVTTILDEAGCFKASAQFWTKESAARGTAVHSWARETIEDGLDIECWPLELQGYGRSLLGWITAVEPRTLATEMIVYDPLAHYCGTLDWLCEFGDGLTIVELKAAHPEPWHAVQTAAYARALESQALHLAASIRRGVLYVQRDGGVAQYVPAYRPRDSEVFMSALLLYHFNHGTI